MTSTINRLNSEFFNLEKNQLLMGICLINFTAKFVLLGLIRNISLDNQCCLSCRKALLLRNSQWPVFLIAILPSIQAEVEWRSNIQKYKTLCLVLES